MFSQKGLIEGFLDTLYNSVSNCRYSYSKCRCSSVLRVTGKMVGTASHESVQAGTKLLDIPLNPENNMTAL